MPKHFFNGRQIHMTNSFNITNSIRSSSTRKSRKTENEKRYNSNHIRCRTMTELKRTTNRKKLVNF